MCKFAGNPWNSACKQTLSIYKAIVLSRHSCLLSFKGLQEGIKEKKFSIISVLFFLFKPLKQKLLIKSMFAKSFLIAVFLVIFMLQNIYLLSQHFNVN